MITLYDALKRDIPRLFDVTPADVTLTQKGILVAVSMVRLHTFKYSAVAACAMSCTGQGSLFRMAYDVNIPQLTMEWVPNGQPVQCGDIVIYTPSDEEWLRKFDTLGRSIYNGPHTTDAIRQQAVLCVMLARASYYGSADTFGLSIDGAGASVGPHQVVVFKIDRIDMAYIMQIVLASSEAVVEIELGRDRHLRVTVASEEYMQSSSLSQIAARSRITTALRVFALRHQ